MKSEQEGDTARGCLGFTVLVLTAATVAMFWPRGSDEGSGAKKASTNAEEIRKGFHCLSKWDGSLRQLTSETKNRLNDPDSFEHIETWITPVSASGTHRVKMRYSAKNAFGGRVQGEATGTVRNSDCLLSNVEVTG